jgi:hypothetical protein
VQSSYLILPSLARTANPTPGVVNQDAGVGKAPVHTGAHIIINCTAIVTAPSVVFNVEGYDPASDTWYLILASAAIVAAGQTILKIFPGATAAANVAANDNLPMTWRVRPAHGNANSITYSVSANLFG